LERPAACGPVSDRVNITMGVGSVVAKKQGGFHDDAFMQGSFSLDPLPRMTRVEVYCNCASTDCRVQIAGSGVRVWAGQATK